jgi:hypothetical protein
MCRAKKESVTEKRNRAIEFGGNHSSLTFLSVHVQHRPSVFDLVVETEEQGGGEKGVR